MMTGILEHNKTSSKYYTERCNMSEFDVAVRSMAGNQRKNDFITKNDAASIVDAAIQILQVKDTYDSVESLNELRNVILNGEFSIDKLKEITEYVAEDDYSGESIQLTGLQMLRFSRTYPIAYQQYASGVNKGFTNKVMNSIVEQFPTSIDSKIVFKDANRESAIWTNYYNSWKTAGSARGEGYAFAYDHDVYLLHFVDNIFDVGIILCYNVLKLLVRLYDTGGEVILTESPAYGNINFRCILAEDLAYDHYEIYVEDEKVMNVSHDVMRQVCDVVKHNERTRKDLVERYRMNLVRGGI